LKLLDHNWRLNNLYKIVDKNGNRVTFRPNNVQQIIDRTPGNRKMILKARQFGVSTYSIIKKFDLTIFRPNTTCAIIAHEKDAVEKLFRIAMRAYKFLPDDIRPVIDRGGGSKHEMYFPEINSRIYCDLEIRGDTVQILHGSEVAFMKDSSKLKATLQAVPSNGIVDLETTANGMGNFFYEMWNDVEQPYKKLFFPWYIFKEYMMHSSNLELTEDELELISKAKNHYGIDIDNGQIAYRRYKKSELKTLSHDKKRVTFEQEYPEDDKTCFLSSGESVLDLFIIKDLMDKAPSPISDNGWLRVFERFDKKETYVVGADVAEGVRKDYSVGVMLNARTRNVVATIRGHWKPYEFAHKLNDLCKMYHDTKSVMPLLSVERNNHGHAVLLELDKHIQYPNLYHHDDEKLGWRTDLVSRPIMINAFIHAVENNYLIINDLNILQECLVLIDNNGKIEAAEGRHDDGIVACAIALQMVLRFGSSDLYENISSKILVD